eukprot:scaffold2911_cov414-Prasinococcus_capsulatus_cf.AAC.37
MHGARFARLVADTDQQTRALAEALNVDLAPTFLFFHKGELKKRFIGGSRGDLIGQILDQLVCAQPLQPLLTVSAPKCVGGFDVAGSVESRQRLLKATQGCSACPLCMCIPATGRATAAWALWVGASFPLRPGRRRGKACGPAHTRIPECYHSDAMDVPGSKTCSAIRCPLCGLTKELEPPSQGGPRAIPCKAHLLESRLGEIQCGQTLVRPVLSAVHHKRSSLDLSMSTPGSILAQVHVLTPLLVGLVQQRAPPMILSSGHSSRRPLLDSLTGRGLMWLASITKQLDWPISYSILGLGLTVP